MKLVSDSSHMLCSDISFKVFFFFAPYLQTKRLNPVAGFPISSGSRTRQVRGQMMTKTAKSATVAYKHIGMVAMHSSQFDSIPIHKHNTFFKKNAHQII